MCQFGHVDHVDANAGFNVALRPSIGQSIVDRDAVEGNTDFIEVQLFESKRPWNQHISVVGVCQF